MLFSLVVILIHYDDNQLNQHNNFPLSLTAEDSQPIALKQVETSLLACIVSTMWNLQKIFSWISPHSSSIWKKSNSYCEVSYAESTLYHMTVFIFDLFHMTIATFCLLAIEKVNLWGYKSLQFVWLRSNFIAMA